jgi:hypothetical protein
MAAETNKKDAKHTTTFIYCLGSCRHKTGAVLIGSSGILAGFLHKRGIETRPQRVTDSLLASSIIACSHFRSVAPLTKHSITNREARSAGDAEGARKFDILTEASNSESLHAVHFAG